MGSEFKGLFAPPDDPASVVVILMWQVFKGLLAP